MIGYGKGRGLFVFFGLLFRLPRPIISFYLPYHYFLLALSLEKYLLSTLGNPPKHLRRKKSNDDTEDFLR